MSTSPGWGWPGRCRSPLTSKEPRKVLSAVSRCSPWNTSMEMLSCCGAIVWKRSTRLTGTVTLRSRIGKNPPGSTRPPKARATATPRLCGQTSVITTSATAACRPTRAACTAAPSATTRSGSRVRLGRRPSSSLTNATTAGSRLAPPTSKTSSRSAASIPASRRQRRTTGRSRPVSSAVTASKSARVTTTVVPPTSTSTRSAVESARLATSTRWRARAVAGGPPGRGAPRDEVEHRVRVVLAAEPAVAARRAHLDEALERLEDGHVERAPAQVEDEQLALLVRVAVPEGQGGRRRLVEDAVHHEAGDARGFDRGLALRVVEVGRHRDDRVGDRLAEPRLGHALELAQHRRRALRRGPRAPAERVGRRRAHVALEERAAGVRRHHEPVLGRAADEERPVGRDGDRRWREVVAQLVLEGAGAVVGEDRHEAVRRPEIDPDPHHVARSSARRGVPREARSLPNAAVGAAPRARATVARGDVGENGPARTGIGMPIDPWHGTTDVTGAPVGGCAPSPPDLTRRGGHRGARSGRRRFVENGDFPRDLRRKSCRHKGFAKTTTTSRAGPRVGHAARFPSSVL